MAIAATVLMPVFNGAAYISEAIQSVLAQTEPNFELLIIDDGSTDDTQSVVASFQHDARLRYLYKANGGIVSALNLGLNHAQSAFIVRLDADDVMLPHRIATQLDFMGQHPHLHGASSDFGWMDKDGVRRGSISIPLTSKAAVDRTLNASLPLIFCHSAIIYRRDTVLQLGAYRETYRDSEDVDLFTRMVDAGFEIVSQPEVLTIVRVHDGSITSRARRRQVMLNDAVVFNSPRRKAGLPERTIDEVHQLLCATPLQKLNFERRSLRQHFHRKMIIAGIKGWRASQFLWGSLVALSDPQRAINAVLNRRRNKHPDR